MFQDLYKLSAEAHALLRWKILPSSTGRENFWNWYLSISAYKEIQTARLNLLTSQAWWLMLTITALGRQRPGLRTAWSTEWGTGQPGEMPSQTTRRTHSVTAHLFGDYDTLLNYSRTACFAVNASSGSFLLNSLSWTASSRYRPIERKPAGARRCTYIGYSFPELAHFLLHTFPSLDQIGLLKWAVNSWKYISGPSTGNLDTLWDHTIFNISAVPQN